MAPLKPVRKDGKDKRVQTVLDFAKKTTELLKNRDVLSTSLEEEIDGIIKRSFPFPAATTLAGKVYAFDTLGCEIWNAATSIIRTAENETDATLKRNVNSRFAALLRVFAFLLIDTAYHGSSKTTKTLDQRVRTFKLALKACRFCLDRGDLDLAIKVLESCSDHVSAAAEDSPLLRISDRDDEADLRATLKTSVSEYYLLRMTHAWKTERIDLAEHFSNQVSASQLADSAGLSEKAADLYYEAGEWLLSRNDLEAAIKWLERALAALDACDLERLSQDAGELRLTISSALVDTLLSEQKAVASRRAQDLVEHLQTAHGFGNRMVVHLMQLKLVLAHQPVDEKRLNSALSRLLRSAVLTEQTYKTIMQAIHRARRASVETACRAIAEMISARLLPDLLAAQETTSKVHLQVETALVTYVHFATSDPQSAERFAIDGLGGLLNAITQSLDGRLSPKAIHAAQTLIWKAAGAADAHSAERWFGLLRHPVFDGAGHVNKAKIGRKAMVMALTRGDTLAAREAFFRMPVAAQNESITRYLAFKLALRSDDHEFALESLNMVMKHAQRDATFLFACVLEAQQSQMRHIAVAALQAILDKQPPGVHLPSLLRCTARLLIGELDSQDLSRGETTEEVVRVFENAAANIQALKADGEDKGRVEIQWWSKNAYNLSLRLCTQIHPEHLVRLLNVCIKFIDHYATDMGPMHRDDIVKRRTTCHFLCATALIVLGRSSDEGSEYSLNCYLQCRQYVEAFREHLQTAHDIEHDRDGRRRLFELHKFDLECVLKLQQWDQLDAVLRACLDFEDIDRWDTLADVVLIIHQQSGKAGLGDETSVSLVELLQRIINDTWKKEQEIVKAARWLRLSFALDLEDGDGKFALRLLGQAAAMAKKGYEGKSELFPETELQWVATTSFNKAVDLLSDPMSDSWNVWVDGALELARYAGDNGALHANLTSKRAIIVARRNGHDV